MLILFILKLKKVVLDVFCNDCQETFDEDTLFGHLRKKHSLARGGKKKQAYLRQQNADRVQANFDGIRFIAHPFNIREIVARFFFKSFKSITAILSANNFEQNLIPRFFNCVTTEICTHMVKVEQGISFNYYSDLTEKL